MGNFDRWASTDAKSEWPKRIGIGCFLDGLHCHWRSCSTFEAARQRQQLGTEAQLLHQVKDVEDLVSCHHHADNFSLRADHDTPFRPRWQFGGQFPRQWLGLSQNDIGQNFASLKSLFPIGRHIGAQNFRSQAGRAQTPLLVLVPPAQEPLVKAVLEAGANSCLVLPVHAKDLASTLARALAGNRPGRHTLGLDRAQREDRWRDDGGEA